MMKGGREVLRVYDNSLSTAISTLFPEHKWQMWRFQDIPPGT